MKNKFYASRKDEKSNNYLNHSQSTERPHFAVDSSVDHDVLKVTHLNRIKQGDNGRGIVHHFWPRAINEYRSYNQGKKYQIATSNPVAVDGHVIELLTLKEQLKDRSQFCAVVSLKSLTIVEHFSHFMLFNLQGEH